ncbi:MAG TPA: peptidylprolyl isomerase [Limnochordia bacterium]|nr:peptidylprolyl isomerase [Limnochordia bacterium]HPT92681.1 peptidylprolyl isomerase [Limnochordia bacterium]HPZ30950.1 peptidylprolyl isomerase [Limnochordia bacterium]HQD70824.1 peptidylprolyl isomerase [Limnochordia bacterium]
MRRKFKAMAKPLIILICVAFLGGALYIGGMSFFGDKGAYAAVATVNGRPITLDALENAYFQEAWYYQLMYGGQLSSNLLEMIRYEAFDILVNNSLIEQELEARKYKPPKADIDREFDALIEQYGRDYLSSIGYTDAQLRQYVTQQLQFQQLVDEITGEIVISDEAVKNSYEQVRASHILVRAEGDEQEAWDNAKALAEQIMGELESLGFEEAAMLYSDDSSGSSGGDLGYIRRGDTVEPFEQAIFSMEVGEVRGPVETQYGYHIIKVTEKKLAEGDEFEAEKESLREQLAEQERVKIFNNWLLDKKNKAEIVILDYQLLAYQHMTNGEYAEAAKAYSKAIEAYPTNPHLYASLGQAYLYLDQLDEAVAQYEKAVEYGPTNGQLHLALASLYMEAERNEEAVAAFLTASELSINDIFAQMMIRSLLSELGAEDAVAVVDQRIAEIQAMYDEINAETGEGTDELVEDTQTDDAADSAE